MSLTITGTTATDFKPIPAGSHIARCVMMVDVGTQKPSNPQYRPKRMVYIGWEIPEETYENDKGERMACRIYRPFSLTLGKAKKPSNLRAFLIGWRGRPFTPEEEAKFELSAILGAGCILNVVHNTVEGTTYANVASAGPLMKGMALPVQSWPSVKYELEQGKDARFETLPEWLQDKIKACLEWNPDATAAPTDDGNGHDDTPATDDEVPF
jgi:hypothetical protein